MTISGKKKCYFQGQVESAVQGEGDERENEGDIGRMRDWVTAG